MKRPLIFLWAWLLALPFAEVRAQDDQYVRIYSLIQEADTLQDRNESAQALARYLEAQAALSAFQKAYPEWNADIVKFRLNYLAGKTAEFRGVSPAPPSTPGAVQTRPTPLPAARTAPADWETQLGNLNAQVRQLQSEKSLLENKLREALAAQPAAVDPREVAKLEERVTQLKKENGLLSARLDEEKAKTGSKTDAEALSKAQEQLSEANRQLAAQKEATTKLSEENEALQARFKGLNAADLAALRAENELLKKQVAEAKATPAPAKSETAGPELAQVKAQLAALQSEKEMLSLEKLALENRLKQVQAAPAATPASAPARADDTAAVKKLERERDTLRAKLDDANKALASASKSKKSARARELEKQVADLQARLNVVEAKPVPYTPEELALFRAPESKLPSAPAGTAPIQQLPGETAAMVAEAQRYFSTRDFDKAEAAYRRVLSQDTKNSPALTDLAVVQMQLNRYDDAEKSVREALTVTPDNAYSLTTLGEVKYKQGKFDEALTALSRAAELDPKSPETQNLLGLVLNQKGMRGPAEAALRKAIQLQPGNQDAHYNLAVVYAAQNPPATELARWHYQKAVSAGHAKNPDLEKLFESRKASAK